MNATIRAVTISDAVHACLVRLTTVNDPTPSAQFPLAPNETVVPQLHPDQQKLTKAWNDLWPTGKPPTDIVTISQRQGLAVAIFYSWIVLGHLKAFDQHGPSSQQTIILNLSKTLTLLQEHSQDHFVDPVELDRLISEVVADPPQPSAANATTIPPLNLKGLLDLFGMKRCQGHGKWLETEHRRGLKSALRTARRGRGSYDPVEVYRILKARGRATGSELLGAKRSMSATLGIDEADFDSPIET
jgi:hypothetical protein